MLDMAAERGADRVTTRALAARLGLTEPALYRHFPEGKTGMWRELAVTVGERMQAGWRSALAGRHGSARERLRALLQAQLQVVHDIPALPAVLFSRTLHRDNAALRAAVGEVAGRFHARVEQIIEQGQHGGELEPALDADAAAWLLISVIQGTTIRWSLNDRGFDLVQEGARVLEAALGGMSRR